MRQYKIFYIGMIIVFLQGCAGAMVYEQNYIDIASSAGHTYQRMFKAEAMVAVGRSGDKPYAQAYCVQDGSIKWLKTTFAERYGHGIVPILAVGVDPELDTIDFRLPLRDFDRKYSL